MIPRALVVRVPWVYGSLVRLRRDWGDGAAGLLSTKLISRNVWDRAVMREYARGR